MKLSNRICPPWPSRLATVLWATALTALLPTEVAFANASDPSATSNAAADRQHWPQWRGPSLDGTSDAEGLPVSWSETENVKWKTPLPSWSGATPVIWGDRIFVPTASALGEGGEAKVVRKMGGERRAEGGEVLLLCLSKTDGKELWRRKLDGGNEIVGKQNMSSPSPVTDGTRVVTLTGTGKLTAFDFDGEQLWRVDLVAKYGKFGLGWGYGASPLLFDGKVIVPVLHGMTTDSPSYLVAIDVTSGKEVWRVERPTDAVAESPDAYTTPVPLDYGDRTEILVSGGDYLTAHDPATGAEIWRCGGINPTKNQYYRTVASPVVVGDLVLACAKRGPTIACRIGGKGDVTESNTVWTSGDIAYDVPTPVTDGKNVYVLNDRGFFACIDPATGEPHYLKARLPKGIYDASPLLADGKIYVTNEGGRTAVLEAGQEFEVLGVNDLDDDYTISSIAVSGRELFIRTSKHLYCIADSAAAKGATSSQ